MPNIIRATLVLLISVLVGSVSNAEQKMRVHFIDVGQGDATLIEFPCGTMLVDTGGERYPKEEWEPAIYDSTRELLAYLDPALGADKRLDLLLLTHPHKDHTRAVQDVIDRFQPRNIVHNGQWHGSGSQDQADALRYSKEFEEVDGWYVLERTIKSANEGLTNWIIDPFKCDGIDPRVRILWGQVKDDDGWNYGDFQDENNHSVVVRVDFNSASLLLTGDLEESDHSGRKAGIERLIEKYQGTDMLDVDVYQVGHHGSHNGTTPELVQAISPKIAVISAGPACERGGYSAWKHAHPRTETIQELRAGVELKRSPPKDAKVFERWNADPVTWTIEKAIYSTGWDGTVVLEANEEGWWKVEVGEPNECLLE